MKKIKALLATIICICIIAGLTGCAANDDYMNDVKGNLSGNSYTIYTYDNYGQKVMTTTGDKINIAGNKTKSKGYDSEGNETTSYDVSSVITILIDTGRYYQSFNRKDFREHIHIRDCELL